VLLALCPPQQKCGDRRDVGERPVKWTPTRADTLSRATVDFSPVPSTTNALGVKDVGEGGTVAATPIVMNANLDALAPLGVTGVPMPATPERIWRTMQDQARGVTSSEINAAAPSHV